MFDVIEGKHKTRVKVYDKKLKNGVKTYFHSQNIVYIPQEAPYLPEDVVVISKDDYDKYLNGNIKDFVEESRRNEIHIKTLDKSKDEQKEYFKQLIKVKDKIIQDKINEVSKLEVELAGYKAMEQHSKKTHRKEWIYRGEEFI